MGNERPSDSQGNRPDGEDDIRVRLFAPEDVDGGDARRDFLSVPRSLALRGLSTCERHRADTMQVLSDSLPDKGVTPESTLIGLAVAWAGHDPSARVALFRHAGDPSAGYLGLFESDGRQDAANAMFAEIEALAAESGMVRLVGPVDGTIWERYRYKVSGFEEKPYLGEPTNPERYPAIWEAAGFSACDLWHADMIPQVAAAGPDKMSSRLQRAVDLGYSFRSLSFRSFRTDIEAIHRLVSNLYTELPGYTPVSFDDFLVRSWPLRMAVDARGTILATDTSGEVVGFMIALPDYGSVRGRGIVRALGMARMRLRPSRYAILHMGVARGHEGLGGAMAALMRRRLAEARVTAVAAFVRDGRPTGAYLGVLSARRACGYALYEKEILPVGSEGPESGPEGAENSEVVRG